MKAIAVLVPRAVRRPKLLLTSLAAATSLAALAAVTLAWPSSVHGDDQQACKAPSIQVYKKEGVLELWCEGKLRRAMPATFGANPVGPKEREGDERTPEGAYTISSRVKSDRFHRFLGVSYPNEADLKRAKEKGIKKVGFGIGIHGTTKKLAPLARLWTRVAASTGLAAVWGPTDGCIGVTNEDIEFLFARVPVGTKVVIAPSRPEKRE